MEKSLNNFLAQFSIQDQGRLFAVSDEGKTQFEQIILKGIAIPVFANEFWTSKQRQSSSIHEISYRACFKAQLPRFFIKLFTEKRDVVYDPFSGRGTTGLEAGLLERKVILNDINPLSTILSRPRFFIPKLSEVEKRLESIPFSKKCKADIDLSMFYHPDTEAEIVSLKNYLSERAAEGKEDEADSWIRMVATNRLTGHSLGFFSVYTLPPNQALSPERQKKINRELEQEPEYRNTRAIILKKTKSLMRELSTTEIKDLRDCGRSAQFLNSDARQTQEIDSESVQLTVTSPPFLDVVQYADDNWLRCWFNGIDVDKINRQITIAKDVQTWSRFIQDNFRELYRITRARGWVAFEVGEVRSGRIKLEEYVVPAGLESGFECKGIVINKQKFTKTANIWGIKNNSKGTNTNRIVIFRK